MTATLLRVGIRPASRRDTAWRDAGEHGAPGRRPGETTIRTNRSKNEP
jgi:hypothetical protein